MGQRARILTEILGFDGWKVTDTFFETAAGERVHPVRGFALIRDTRLVLSVERRWLPRCSKCGGPCHDVHERLAPRRWADLSWHPVELRYAPVRVRCPRCDAALARRDRLVGVVLSGLLDDGTRGLAEIKRLGGFAVVQDPREAEFPWMPRSAIENVDVDAVVEASKIATILQDQARGQPRPSGSSLSSTAASTSWGFSAA